ncbi:unnamed protein product [Zymoseptoria tritici ST99CH_1A5]|uniref:Uncharacterized protein n=3 Tax=Zymoseptoria tritici TaxID=1047171 RepID=A0A1X7RYW3_ZYMT9|nr:unnamed protein product [Zymoseptoria tritici ST99CH_3D7]SMR55440.1 unnamed protein product [Zymoseptoria tritici ST99CH_1E4]SMR57817.1 unnamed protein product [Zymoseptoria tritici ST99CH_3D1]SMY26252.1 unnamed protein product [Zymoseptoria tritici ST99CH_1A5]
MFSSWTAPSSRASSPSPASSPSSPTSFHDALTTSSSPSSSPTLFHDASSAIEADFPPRAVLSTTKSPSSTTEAPADDAVSTTSQEAITANTKTEEKVRLVTTRQPLHFFDFPQEIVDHILGYAYPEEDLAKFVVKEDWDEEEMERKRINFAYELRPFPPRKVCDFMVSKKFFACATAAWVGNQEFIHRSARPASSSNSIFDGLGTWRTRRTDFAIVERLCKRLTTQFRSVLTLDRLPNLSRLTLRVGADSFQVLEPRFAWQFALTEEDLVKVLVDCKYITRLSGLTHLALTPADIKYATSKQQKSLWKTNVSALEKALKPFVLTPLALHKFDPELKTHPAGYPVQQAFGFQRLWKAFLESERLGHGGQEDESSSEDSGAVHTSMAIAKLGFTFPRAESASNEHDPSKQDKQDGVSRADLITMLNADLKAASFYGCGPALTSLTDEMPRLSSPPGQSLCMEVKQHPEAVFRGGDEESICQINTSVGAASFFQNELPSMSMNELGVITDSADFSKQIMDAELTELPAENFANSEAAQQVSSGLAETREHGNRRLDNFFLQETCMDGPSGLPTILQSKSVIRKDGPVTTMFSDAGNGDCIFPWSPCRDCEMAKQSLLSRQTSTNEPSVASLASSMEPEQSNSLAVSELSGEVCDHPTSPAPSSHQHLADISKGPDTHATTTSTSDAAALASKQEASVKSPSKPTAAMSLIEEQRTSSPRFSILPQKKVDKVSDFLATLPHAMSVLASPSNASAFGLVEHSDVVDILRPLAFTMSSSPVRRDSIKFVNGRIYAKARAEALRRQTNLQNMAIQFYQTTSEAVEVFQGSSGPSGHVEEALTSATSPAQAPAEPSNIDEKASSHSGGQALRRDEAEGIRYSEADEICIDGELLWYLIQPKLVERRWVYPECHNRLALDLEAMMVNGKDKAAVREVLLNWLGTGPYAPTGAAIDEFVRWLFDFVKSHSA